MNENAVKVFCEKGTFLFEQLGAVNTVDLVAEKVKPARTKWPVRPDAL